MNWKQILSPAMNSQAILSFKGWLKSERENKDIYPTSKDLFRAFDLCQYEDTRVVIFGQDPYHSEGTADGLAFSTRQTTIPPSLMVIFREIYRDLNIQYFHNITIEEFFPTGNLENWARNGFLLLNTALTVEKGIAGSHQGKGWEILIEAVLKALNEHPKQLIFCLWGKNAKELRGKISARHMILSAAHPAAELYNPGQKAGFYWSRHFSIIRDILPVNNDQNINPSVNFMDCFDKEKAKKIIKEHYPIDAEKLIQYIEDELIIHAPLSKERYYAKLKEFELSLSTKHREYENKEV
jgi:uracil-DNA glycosylase